MEIRLNCPIERLWPLAMSLAILTGCGPGADSGREGTAAAPAPVEVAAASDPAAVSMPAPSWEEASNATFHGLDEAVTLHRGAWKGEPYVEGGASAPRVGLVPDFWLSGDLDGDGDEESVVLLWTSSGGSGTFDYLAVLDRAADGSAVNRAVAPLGDRVKVRSAAIGDGVVVLETIQAGPEDAACCPGQKMRRTFTLETDQMTEGSTEDQGRVSLADIEGEWVLTHMNRDDLVPDEVEITLTVAGDQVSGKSACNRYSGAVSAGDSPGELRLAGPLASTRMMCPEQAMEWEGLYLAALQELQRFSFVAGQLILEWQSADQNGSLTFARAAVSDDS